MSAPRTLLVAAASQLNTKLRLTGIVLHAIKAGPANTHTGGELEFNLQLQNVAVHRAPNGVRGIYGIGVQVDQVDKSGRNVLGVVQAAMRLEYQFETMFEDAADGAKLDDYLGIVGWMHAWPYLRAEVQALSTRLGLPPLVLPVLLAGQTRDVAVEWQAAAVSKPEQRTVAKVGKSKPAPARPKKPRAEK